MNNGIPDNKEEFLQMMQENHGPESPVLRYLLGGNEIKWANQLVKEGKLIKGTMPKGRSLTKGWVIFYTPTKSS